MGEIIQSINLANTFLMVVTDHGRRQPFGFDHGLFTQTEMNTQWIAFGPEVGVRRGYELKLPVGLLFLV